jgi:YD repeat-containing protein
VYNGSNQLESITYVDGTLKEFTYNGDGTLNTVTVTLPDAASVVKTMTYSGGILTDITVS